MEVEFPCLWNQCLWKWDFHDFGFVIYLMIDLFCLSLFYAVFYPVRILGSVAHDLIVVKTGCDPGNFVA
jgi:hypothetical protein